MSSSRTAGSAGFVMQPRGLFDQPVFDGRFDRRSAFMWMVERAERGQTAIDIAGIKIVLERGQLCHSLRFMAQEWGWEQSSVRRFLKALNRAGEAATSPATGTATSPATSPATRQTVVTIYDFDRFQGSPRGGATSTATSAGDKPPQIIRIKEEKEEVVGAAHQPRARADGRQLVVQEFESWWPIYPHKVAKPAARTAFMRARKKASLAELVEGVRQYIANKPTDQLWRNPATWLNQEGWNDEPAPTPSSGGPSRRIGASSELETLHRDYCDLPERRAA